MQLYCNSLTNYSRLKTREVKIGDLLLGNFHPVRVQTMTTTDTMDTIATVEQSIRCIEAGAELVRITAPSKKEAENLLHIKNELRRRGYTTPLVADIHFTPNAAEIAARIVEKVRVNPGNYIDKKKFEVIDYTDAEYQEEIARIRQRFTPLIKICREYGTAMRIGTNHGSLSDRIMSRYGDTPMGMVESAMEFLRIARNENYHNIVLSMKASNPQVMVQAYRLLVQQMDAEFGECYPLHLGVTEAGDGEDGRVKSAAGIGTLMEDGIGDTIRVSLTEDPEFEIPVCRDIVKRYNEATVNKKEQNNHHAAIKYDPFNYKRRETIVIDNIGGHHVPVVVADLSKIIKITPAHLKSIGYTYNEATDKWAISDAAADYIFTGTQVLDFALPGTLKVIVNAEARYNADDQLKYLPLYNIQNFIESSSQLPASELYFVKTGFDSVNSGLFARLSTLLNNAEFTHKVVLCLYSVNKNAMQNVRQMFSGLLSTNIKNPAIILCESTWQTADEHLIHYSTECGALLLDGFGDGVWLGMKQDNHKQAKLNASGRKYLDNASAEQFINNTAFSILQATRTRISKTEYISCPSCGRTLFDLQETTAKIRARTNHLKGVKIAIMGCIVNGPGEMADADFGYVGSGVGKITLYKGKEVVKRNVDSAIAVDELINLLKENAVWIEESAAV
ncbi:MAG TPA: (E)-4-hydroxy-3-methylbut-2-enyl-diphosphate synthase [Chitinophagaceae bacterium]|nr:(E)-4-hydroxy-3-methylbut-2-enyl-diphosphate synthase [Chitinophagaceae bacterium]